MDSKPLDIPDGMKPENEEELKKMHEEVSFAVGAILHTMRENKIAKPIGAIAMTMLLEGLKNEGIHVLMSDQVPPEMMESN